MQLSLLCAEVPLILDGPDALLSPFASMITPFCVPSPFPDAWSIAVDFGPHSLELDVQKTQYFSASSAFELCESTRTGRAFVTRFEALFGLFELVLQVALLPLGGLILHACGAVYRGDGWLCFGPSGAGKSTAGRNAGFDRVLSDERAIVRPEGDRYRLWSTPFWSSGSQIRRIYDSAPLAYIGWLQKASNPRFEQKPLDEMAALLLRCVKFYQNSSTARVQAFESACRLVEHVLSGALSVPKEGPWLDAILRTISMG